MKPRISIIVPCYNGEEYLRETLECLLKQTIEDWECVVVNDGSTDGSLEIMKEYAARDSRYRYIDIPRVAVASSYTPSSISSEDKKSGRLRACSPEQQNKINKEQRKSSSGSEPNDEENLEEKFGESLTAGSDPDVSQNLENNHGPSVARNTGIAVSSGKYILPLDADDLIAPTYAEKAMEYLEGHERCKVVYGKAEFFGDRNEPFELKDYDYNELPYNNTIFCSCVYRRSDFDKTPGYNPNMKYRNEDWDFLLSLLNEDDDVYCIPEVLFYYRQHGVTRNNNIDEKYAFANLQMVINHPEVYLRDKERTLNWINPMLNYYRTELDKLLDSKSYKLGHWLLAPLRWLQSFR